MSCRIEPTLITQTEPVSRVASANYGTFSALGFEAPGGFLAADTMSDGRASILYYFSPTEIEPVIFDPATDTFASRHAPIAFKKDREMVTISQTLFINDSTVVVVWGGSMEKLSSDSWLYGRIINLDSGEVVDVEGAEQIGEIRVLLELNDQKFVVAGIKGRPQKELLNTDPDFDKPQTGMIKTFDLTGKEIESKDITGADSYAVPTTAATNTYDRGDDILIFSDRLTIFDKTKLTFTPVSNTTKAATVKVLPNGLLLAYPEPFDLESSSVGQFSDKVYLINPENRQSITIKLANAFPIREQMLTGITEVTSEKLVAALAPLKLKYRVSILNDGTILLAADSLYDIGAYHWLIDLNGYKMLQPVDQIARTRLSTVRIDSRWSSFDDDITLADGRVLYLGDKNVLYTPASERTSAQEEIVRNKTNLPDWPSTDFKTQGIWSTVGYSAIVNKNKTVEKAAGGFQPLPTLRGIFTDSNNAQFFWGARNVGDTISAIVESWRYGGKTTTTLLQDSVKLDDGIKNDYPIHDKYSAMLTEQKQERYITKAQNKIYRIGLPQTGIPACDAIPPQQGNCPDANPSAQIEKYNTTSKEWVGVRDGKLTMARAGQSVTTLLDGKILVVGGTANIGNLPAEEALGEGRYTQNWLFGTLTLYGKQYGKIDPVLYYSSLGMTEADLQKLNVKLGLTKSVEVYDPKTNKSKEIGKLKIGRRGQQIIILPDDKIAVIGGDEQSIIVKDGRDNFQGVAHAASTYEILDLKTGESKLYENVLMFRHDTNDFQAFVMPNGHIYIGDSGVYSGAEVLDWQNGISYPTGQPFLQGLGESYTTAQLKNGELVSVGADEDEIRSSSNAIIGHILDTSVIATYHPASSGGQLPIAKSATQEAITDSYAWRWFLYLQLAQLLIGLPLAYLLALARRDRQKFIIPL